MNHSTTPPDSSADTPYLDEPQASVLDHSLHLKWAVPTLVLLVAFPFVASATGSEFYVGLISRVLIFALAATSLNLILGFGGMVSFGHAAFVGLGAYAVAVLGQAGLTSAWVVWPLAMLITAAVALLIGAVSLRTQGVYFIMITLAFAQMLYYLVTSLKVWGGDDGIAMADRSQLGMGLDLAVERDFYFVTLT
ncbi:MAG: branched-chain amino acid ABC transporter permease, partial [Burkholderiales bacterium]|nr:branched-chain amino acid ABC transporter permease [Burkholderiales bacterium]